MAPVHGYGDQKSDEEQNSRGAAIWIGIDCLAGIGLQHIGSVLHARAAAAGIDRGSP